MPLSTSLDSVGGLTRTVEDSAYFFAAIDPVWGDANALLRDLRTSAPTGLRIAVPKCGIWSDCQVDIADVLECALDDLVTHGWHRRVVNGSLLDQAKNLYMTAGIAGVECRAFLERDLPGWLEILHPTVGSRLAGAPALDSEHYTASIAEREHLMDRTEELFAEADLLALPTAIITPPPVSDLSDTDRYGAANAAALGPTCPINLLGLCAITLSGGTRPVRHAGGSATGRASRSGRDAAGRRTGRRTSSGDFSGPARTAHSLLIPSPKSAS